MNRIQLVVGDWSHDGHNMTCDVFVECSLSRSELEDAFNKGVKKLGVNLTKYCEAYEDSSIPKDVYLKIAAVDPSLTRSKDGDTGTLKREDDVDFNYTDDQEYATLWMLTAKAGRPTMEWTLADIPYEQRICIGGYGLFST